MKKIEHPGLVFPEELPQKSRVNTVTQATNGISLRQWGYTGEEVSQKTGLAASSVRQHLRTRNVPYRELSRVRYWERESVDRLVASLPEEIFVVPVGFFTGRQLSDLTGKPRTVIVSKAARRQIGTLYRKRDSKGRMQYCRIFSRQEADVLMGNASWYGNAPSTSADNE